jgi:hypothetical protein
MRTRTRRTATLAALVLAAFGSAFAQAPAPAQQQHKTLTPPEVGYQGAPSPLAAEPWCRAPTPRHRR